MKLYTEEQVRKAIEMAQDYGTDCDDIYFYYNANDIIGKLTPIESADYEKVTRFEVIDHTSSKEGRILVRYSVMVDVSVQDEGMTMKVFLTDKYQS